MTQEKEFKKILCLQYDGLSIDDFYNKVKELTKNIKITQEDLDSDICSNCENIDEKIALLLTEEISFITCKEIMGYDGYNEEIFYIVPLPKNTEDIGIYLMTVDLESLHYSEIYGNARLFIDNYVTEDDMSRLSKICYDLIDSNKGWNLFDTNLIDLSKGFVGLHQR